MTPRSSMARVLTLVIAGAALSGCAVYPAGPYSHGGGRGYGRPYAYAPPAWGGHGYGHRQSYAGGYEGRHGRGEGWR